MIQSFRKVFEEKIFELGYSLSNQQGGFYILFEQNLKYFLDVRLIISEQPNLSIHGSKNGLDIQAIGLFKFNQPLFYQDPDFYIFMFQNRYNQRIEYLIIPNDELKKRLSLRSSDFERQKLFRIMFWLMPDNSIYDTTRISPEGEWYFLSKGVNERMADKGDMDYTTFLNNWGLLNRS
ncbi:MAG TPA: hypothetical protein DDW27_15655 [Bacteroidales bacterium]|nr:hypothetical protein [Bacteroidales bacterium]